MLLQIRKTRAILSVRLMLQTFEGFSWFPPLQLAIALDFQLIDYQLLIVTRLAVLF